MFLRSCDVPKRILFGVVAWLLGAATATAGSLLAVALLGQGIGGNSAQQLTEGAVNRALAREVTEIPAPTATTVSPAVHSARPRPASPSARAAGAPPSAGPAPTASAATAPPQAEGTLLTSRGGEVVASCQPAGAYLLSWSPLQGYDIDYVLRGPAATARVTFESTATRVTMFVSCSAGVPTAVSSTGDE
jgi:serine/threonine-protein kinase